MKKYFALTIIALLSIGTAKSQLGGKGIIINEVSNGPNGNQEWVELLVIGDSNNPTAPVDLTGWIIDDNNGDFELSGGGVGIATGHFRLTSKLNNVKPGALIVVYNSLDKDPLIPTDDPTDANGDNIYIIPDSDSAVQGCDTRPSAAPADPTYVICNWIPALWSYIQMRNDGDVFQTRRPDATFFHGFSFGDVNTVYPTFPDGSSSFNMNSNSALGLTFRLDCSNWYVKSNFSTILAADATPGRANTQNNLIMIQKITCGSFDYSNLDNPDNCIYTSGHTINIPFSECENVISIDTCLNDLDICVGNSNIVPCSGSTTTANGNNYSIVGACINYNIPAKTQNDQICVNISTNVLDTVFNSTVYLNYNNTQLCTDPELIIPNFISPNGDGKNDYWVISNLYLFPEAAVKIFNRWGSLVYTKENYDNSWNGELNNGTTLFGNSKQLPSGTYFYILETNGSDSKNHTGYIHLQR